MDSVAEEGKALLKDLGFDGSETPGRRSTRAAARGEVYTPPAKKERNTQGRFNRKYIIIFIFYQLQ